MKCNNCKQYNDVISCTVNSQENHHSFNDLPALKELNGSKWWYLNGDLHRENGPACEFETGDKCWYLNGKRHRVMGPACEYVNASKHWYLNGKPHREDGPAVEYINGKKIWYLNGKEAIQIPKQGLYIQKTIQIDGMIAIIINKMNDDIWKVLIGDEKKLVASVL